MFQVTVLASGSKGNAFLIRTEQAKVILDNGLSGKKLFAAMEKNNLQKDKICAVVVSHEHSDHIGGVGVLCRKLKIPLYITKHTHFVAKHKIKNIDKTVNFSSGKTFVIGDLEFSPFQSSHDAVDSHNFVITQLGNDLQKLGIVTDLGYVTKLHNLKLKNVTTLLLESNHDPQMLMNGPYTWQLKQRVKGRTGHLSNEQAVGLVTQVISDKMKNLVLVHLSEINNTPELARNLMQSYLRSINSEVVLSIANQYEPTAIFDV